MYLKVSPWVLKRFAALASLKVKPNPPFQMRDSSHPERHVGIFHAVQKGNERMWRAKTMARANLGRSRQHRFWCFCALALLSVGSIAAPSQQVGDWYYSLNGDISEAYTVSDSGATFGLLCSRSANSCAFYIRSSTTCEGGQSGAVLENAPSGSANLTGACRPLTTQSGTIYAIVLTPTTGLASSLGTNGQEVGFAEPMEGGQFRVYRFSTTGAGRAIGVVTKFAEIPVGDQTY